jgi:hypothetical protein
MIDADPVELRGEILFSLAHEVTGEASQVRHLEFIIGRDDENRK